MKHYLESLRFEHVEISTLYIELDNDDEDAYYSLTESNKDLIPLKCISIESSNHICEIKHTFDRIDKDELSRKKKQWIVIKGDKRRRFYSFVLENFDSFYETYIKIRKGGDASILNDYMRAYNISPQPDVCEYYSFRNKIISYNTEDGSSLEIEIYPTNGQSTENNLIEKLKKNSISINSFKFKTSEFIDYHQLEMIKQNKYDKLDFREFYFLRDRLLKIRQQYWFESKRSIFWE